MASPLIFDLSAFDLDAVALHREDIYARMPQRYEFEQLDGIIHVDHARGEAVAFRNVDRDEWWCRGHIPGSPLLPGVLMLESAAHLAAYMECYSNPEFKGFVGYGGVDACKFRKMVKPPCRLWLLCRRVEARSRRIICYVQGIVDDVLVFETTVTGLVMPV